VGDSARAHQHHFGDRRHVRRVMVAISTRTA
jgi:hypothetical protein